MVVDFFGCQDVDQAEVGTEEKPVIHQVVIH
jgi:hypothetical protein